ncbi:MAG: XdhC family protein [Bacteriovoracaceae bacterium]|nr:XdhC family protein [Bacteriovoracaceae bacterium]
MHGGCGMIEKAWEWIKDGKEVALATVIATWGSSPQPVGSQMVIDGDGRFEGSVSGGCVEGAVVEEALEVIRKGKHRRLFFGVSRERAWEVGLACGGEMEVFVEKVTWLTVLEELLKLRAACRPACLITDLQTGGKTLVPLDEAPSPDSRAAGLMHLVEGMKSVERNTTAVAGGRELFLHSFQPSPRLVIIGAVHIAQALVRIGRVAGYEVSVVDPREAFADTVRFPDVQVCVEWPDEAIKRMGLHSRTAVVTLTHDPKLDDPALEAALESNVFYIGALGSRKTHAARLERFRQAGLAEEMLERIHGPVGLDIGAVSPEEIALSIMAEITSVRRRGDSRRKVQGAVLPATGDSACSR